jgi:hypothetical protein
MCGWRAALFVIWTLSTLPAAAAALAGCAGASEPPKVSVTVAAEWNAAPTSQQAFGFTLSLAVNQWRRAQAGCTAQLAPVRFTINDEAVGLTRPDPNTRCIDFTVALGPMPDVPEAVTVRYETEGRLLAMAAYHRLAPGPAAVLAAPADGQVRAGDEVVVVPPPELPTSLPTDARFYPLDPAEAARWPQYGVLPEMLPTRLPDGIHVKVPPVPPLAGRVALVITGPVFDNQADVACDGFGACQGTTATVVGPVYLTVLP